MPVDSTHPLYQARIKQWQRCRDAYEGQDAIKDRTTTYVPRPTKMKIDHYNRRLDRALWYGATGRAVQVLTGVISRKEPTVEAPERIQDYLDDVTLDGTPLASFSDMTLDETFITGRYGILTSMPVEQAEEKRPYWVLYEAEQIINWDWKRRNGRMVLSLVVLKEEPYQRTGGDEFHKESTEQYRVLRLEDVGLEEYPDGIYTVSIYQKVDKEWAEIDRITPVREEAPLPYIPFRFVNASHLLPRPNKPPLLDLVDINIAHFKNSVVYETAIQVTGSPTPVGKMLDTENEIVLGSESMIKINDPEGDFFFASYDGAGIEPMEKAMEKKEKHMAAIAARALEGQQLDPEAEGTVRMRRSGETSMVQSVALVNSLGLTEALRDLAWWAGVPEDRLKDISVRLNMDLVDVRLSGQDLTALVDAYFRGAMSWPTFYEQLRKGEIAREGISAEKELEEIQNRENGDLAQDRTGRGAGAGPTPEEEATIEEELDRIEAEGVAA